MLKAIVARSARNRGVITAEVVQDWGGTEGSSASPRVRYQPPYSPAVTVTVPPSTSPRVGSDDVIVGGPGAEFTIQETTYARPPDMTFILPNVYTQGGLNSQAHATIRKVPIVGGEA